MKCIWCKEREIAQDIFCQQCYDELDDLHKAWIGETFEAACMRLAKSAEALKQAVKASLPRWLQRVFD